MAGAGGEPRRPAGVRAVAGDWKRTTVMVRWVRGFAGVVAVPVLAGMVVAPAQAAAESSTVPDAVAPAVVTPQAAPPASMTPRVLSKPRLAMKPAVASTLDRTTVSVPAAVAVAVRPRLVVKPSTSTLLDTPAPVSVDPASTLHPTGDGVCADGTAGRPRRVRVAGPSGISITGFARCASGRNWTAVVDGGRGSIGGVTLASGAFRGTIVSTGGVVVADVRVGMGAHPRVVPAWGQRASVRLVHSKAGWSGQVTVRASRGGNRLVMAGPLLADGSYLLRARGETCE